LSLRFGVHLPIHGAYDFSATLKTAITADRLGYHSIWVGDHFFLPEGAYVNIGGDPKRPDKLDAWTGLAAIAVQTKQVKIGTRVSPIPFYLPARLAKIVATVDVISHGRVILGVGAGWYKEEAVSYGVEWNSHRERIAKMVEGLEAILKLWTEERATYRGTYYQLANAPFWPKPVQKPHPPAWFGGSSKAIIDATVRYGNGILPLTDMSLEKYQELTRQINNTAERLKIEKKVTMAPSLSYPGGMGATPAEWLKNTKRYAEKGADIILLDFTQTKVSHEKAIEFLEEFSQKVFPEYRK
jgi:alkanesulfonate monooxygenase SsuD/methylene tetrahydromethanopterin reductase-like flavin-dependent oxidoreductase (luciferase family)